MCSISNLLSLQALQGCILTHAEIQTIQQRIRKDMTFCKTFSQIPGVNWIYMLISNSLKPSAHIQNRTQNLRNSVKDAKVNNFLSISDGLYSQFLQESLISTHLQKEQTCILFYAFNMSDHD